LHEDYRVLAFGSGAEAISALESEEAGVLVLGQRIRDQTPLELLAELNQRHPNAQTVRILVARHPGADELTKLINVGGIFHFVQRPFQSNDVLQSIRHAIDRYAMQVENAWLGAELARANQRLQRENLYLRRRMTGTNGFEHILGSSPALRQALVHLARIRLSEATVHINGETGTGKELVARGIHFGGPRAKGPFVAQNCAGITDSLLESTLFGHQRGAFTGADRARPGVFQEAHGGTLFLDEVGELSGAVQGALLRALQSGEIVPVGSSRPTRVDVRVISATHRDLREEAKSGRFREDLYFRLVVIGIRLPPLRERSGDVPLLARHFLDVYCERFGRNVPGFTYDAMQALEKYSWPGNVRELENEIERLIVLAEDGRKIPVDLLSPHLVGRSVSRPAIPAPPVGGGTMGVPVPSELTYDQAVENFQRALIGEALGSTGGVVARAAKVLGMERTRLLKLRRKFGL
jgi:two-component system response regulator HupR/HoxA